MKKSLLLMSVLAGMTFGGTLTAHADEVNNKTAEEQVQEQMKEATVAPIISKNQVGTSNSFYYMKWNPGSEDTIGVKISNNTDKDKTYEIKQNKAMTNSNGVMVYDLPDMNGVGVEPRIGDMLGLPSEITVKAHSTEELMTTMKYENKDLVGFKIGGFVISEKTQPSKDKQFNQKLAYALPILIEGNAGRNPETNFSFGKFAFKRIGAGIYSIETPFNNANANWMQKANATIVVKDSTGKEVLKDDKSIDIAPEGEVSYKAMFDKDLPADTYEVTATVKSNVGEWSDTQKVKLTKEQAKDVAETVNIGDKKKQSIFDNIFFDLLVVLISGVVGYVVGKSTDKKTRKKTDDVQKDNE